MPGWRQSLVFFCGADIDVGELGSCAHGPLHGFSDGDIRVLSLPVPICPHAHSLGTTARPRQAKSQQEARGLLPLRLKSRFSRISRLALERVAKVV